ncbi:YdgA family protein [Rhizobium sp. P38BS-XIX]|uniref:YdgA family protein n=1 Tax=Rhizobium sp. P38BS-XIX TaxID=2726740 RepID=UPI00145744CA|nr:YdgA family protein [Rhizobium sp. P38BS-XIX]NLR95619.1 YdgA family protein [Rhizobium sp. P38BS-XIX]
MTFYRTTRLMLCSAAILSFASSAFALDGNDLLKKLNDVYGQQGGASIAAEGIDIDGDTVTLKNATLKAAGMENDIPLGEITMNGVEEKDGGYTIEEVDFADVDFNKDGAAISATDLKLNGVEIPADATKGDLSSLLYYKSAHAGAISVSKDDAEVFSIEGADATMSKRSDNSGIDFDAKVNGIKGDLSKVDDPKAKEAIDALKLQQIDGTVAMKGSWEIGPGKIDITEYSFDFKDIGKLDLAFSISGYTPAFAKSLQDALKTVRSNPNQQEAQQSAGLAMLGLMQQLTFNSAKIRFDDASITARALDFAGKQQGVTGKQLADTLKAMTPMMMAQLNIPELQNAVSTAVNTYLDNPKSMTVTAAPGKPVPVPMIIGAAMGAPQTIPQVIGLTVSSND